MIKTVNPCFIQSYAFMKIFGREEIMHYANVNTYEVVIAWIQFAKS